MRRSASGRAGLTTIAAVAVLAGVSSPGAEARAVDGPEATKIALSVLEPRREPGVGAEVHVFASTAALRPGTVISQPGPGERKVKLRRPAWLFWEDLAYPQLFPHPSKLLLIDARTGRVAARRDLTLYPLIDGRPLKFPRSAGAYTNRAAALARELPIATAARAADLSNDGFVAIGQRDDPAFKADFKAVDALAKDLKVPKLDAEPSAAGLKKAIETLIELNKKDIVLLIGGHGYPEKDEYYTDKDGKPQLKAPGSAKPKLTLDEKENSAETLTSSQLRDLLSKFPQVTFKVVIASCYAGRFLDDLKQLNGEIGPKNLAVAMTAANNKEPTTVGFWSALSKGLRDWAAGAGAADRLADGLRKAFDSDAVKNWAANSGMSHPQITPKPAAPPRGATKSAPR